MELSKEDMDYITSVVRRFAKTHSDIEGVVQDAHLKVLERLHTFKGDSSLRTWLYTVSSRVAIDALYAERKEVGAKSTSDPNSLISEGSDPESVLYQGQLVHFIKDVIDGLPPHHKGVAELMVRGGVSYQEMADRLGVPIGTIRSRVYTVRARLRAALDNTEEGV